MCINSFTFITTKKLVITRNNINLFVSAAYPTTMFRGQAANLPETMVPTEIRSFNLKVNVLELCVISSW